MKTIKIDWNDDIPDNFTGIVEISNGQKKWYKNGKLHRTDGPAWIDADGAKFWLQNGKLHREDGGPAVEYPYGYKVWFQHDKLHRTDGPAVMHRNGDIKYYINGKETYKEAVEVYAALFPDSP